MQTDLNDLNSGVLYVTQRWLIFDVYSNIVQLNRKTIHIVYIYIDIEHEVNCSNIVHFIKFFFFWSRKKHFMQALLKQPHKRKDIPGISTRSKERSFKIKIGIQQSASVNTMKKKRLARIISFLI